MAELRLATRGSPLALAQTAIVARALVGVGVATSVVTVDTSGDRDRVSPVATLTEVGAFVRAVQWAVLDGRADAAVHSGKDVPVMGPPELIGFHPERGEPWDALCGGTVAGLRPGAVVGTGSPRRGAQLTLLRPDLDVTDIRGNVGTRLQSLGAGYDAVVLAVAGLERIGRLRSVTHKLGLAEMVPAPAQAALTIETRPGTEAAEALASIAHSPTTRAVSAERHLLAETGAGCRSALGAYAVEGAGGAISVTGFVDDEHGPRRSQSIGDTPEEAATRLKRELGL